MNIGILEYHYHWIYVKTLEKICSNHKVHVFKDIKLAQDATSWLDLLFVNTIQPVPWDVVKWFRFKSKCKMILTVHEANTDFITNKIIIKKFDAINAPYLPMKDYITKKGLYNGILFTLPFMVHEKRYYDTNNMYVVPGRIEKFRRDYNVAFDMMKKNQSWCFLGEPIGKYGNNVIEKCKEMNREGYNITYFDRYVSNDVYDDTLKGCNTVVAPLKNPTLGTNKLIKETYGQSKACGAIFESIRFGKPFISNLDICVSYKDYLLDDWKKYFEEKVVEFVRRENNGKEKIIDNRN